MPVNRDLSVRELSDRLAINDLLCRFRKTGMMQRINQVKKRIVGLDGMGVIAQDLPLIGVLLTGL